MPLPDQTPKLPKWPFLIGDAALLGAAWLIAQRAAHPLTGTAIIALTICVGLAALIGVIPFLTDYARVQDEALDERQRSLEALGRTIGAAGEQIGIAAGGFHEIVELARKNLAEAEQFQQRFLEKTSELQSKLGATRAPSPDWSKIESTHQKHLAALKAALTDFESRVAAARVLPDAPPMVETVAAPLPPPVVEPVPEASTPAPAPEPVAAEATEAAEAPPRKRAPRKPKPDALPETARPEPVAEAIPSKTEPDDDTDTPTFEFAQTAPEETMPAVSVSADGATRLLVTAYIGIGNRLFVRGEGPGLSWDRGVPLQFVSIGKWRWETADATAPVKFKLYKNDEIESTALGSSAIEPGQQQEVTATF